MKAWLAAAGGVLLLGIAILVGIGFYRSGHNADSGPIKPQGTSALDEAQPGGDIQTVDLPFGVDPSRGATPMADRVAVLGFLNKRNGASRDLKLKPGQAIRVGDVIVRLRACEQTAPWEADHYTGAFVQMDVQQTDKKWQRVFSGWLYKERPALNVVQHPVYDVWPKSCAMTFPDKGPDTVSAETRSIAKKSAGDDASGASADNAVLPAPAAATPAAAPPAPAPARPARADDSSPR